MKQTRHHGLALMLVMVVVAMATLIGVAMLSNAALQAQSAGGHARAAVADYMAESAIQSAAYYLQRNLAAMPASWTGHTGHTIYAQGVTVTNVAGSFDLDVVATSTTDVYQATATGYSGGSESISRTIISRIKTVRATPNYPGGFGGPTTINLQNYFTGAQAVANGTLSGAGLLNILLGYRTSFSTSEFIVPAAVSGELNYYGGNVANGTYTTSTGVAGTPQILSSGTISSPATLSALASNPGKVFYYGSDVFITGAGTYNGTLIARGKIDIRPPLGSTIQWNRQPDFPALMSDGTFAINSRAMNLTINGVVYAGKGTAWGAGLAVTGTNVRINGSLLIPAGQPLAAGGLGSMTVDFTASTTDVRNMTTIAQPITSVKYLSWDQ